MGGAPTPRPYLLVSLPRPLLTSSSIPRREPPGHQSPPPSSPMLQLSSPAVAAHLRRPPLRRWRPISSLVLASSRGPWLSPWEDVPPESRGTTVRGDSRQSWAAGCVGMAGAEVGAKLRLCAVRAVVLDAATGRTLRVPPGARPASPPVARPPCRRELACLNLKRSLQPRSGRRRQRQHGRDQTSEESALKEAALVVLTLCRPHASPWELLLAAGCCYLARPGVAVDGGWLCYLRRSALLPALGGFCYRLCYLRCPPLLQTVPSIAVLGRHSCCNLGQC
jgi:hypothetical protein